jgi:serine/threonine protein kinase
MVIMATEASQHDLDGLPSASGTESDERLDDLGKEALSEDSKDRIGDLKLAVHTYDRIGNYILGKTLGEGAFAKVKEATHAPTGKEVAIKIIFKSDQEDYVLKNLHREGQLMRRCQHPHIIRLYEVVETQKALCIVTERASGGEVLDYIVAHGTVDFFLYSPSLFLT